jgi:hypothetical protein
MVQPCGLRGKVTRDLNIEPILNLSSQMKDFDGHSGIPLKFRNRHNQLTGPRRRNSGVGFVYSVSR